MNSTIFSRSEKGRDRGKWRERRVQGGGGVRIGDSPEFGGASPTHLLYHYRPYYDCCELLHVRGLEGGYGCELVGLGGATMGLAAKDWE